MPLKKNPSKKAKEPKKEHERSIRRKMLAFILPILILGMGILTSISVASSKSIITHLTMQGEESDLQTNCIEIQNILESVRLSAIDLANMYSHSYDTMPLEQYKAAVANMLDENDIMLGSGVWFEPYVYNKSDKYYGPYWYKDGNQLVKTWDYSNAEYDYFNQEYYTSVVNMETIDINLTDPYYDETTDITMASCSAPMIGKNGFLGCITVDIDLTSIQSLVKDSTIGKNGYSMLLTSSGIYMYTPLFDCSAMDTNISNDSNASLAALSSNILNNESGHADYTIDGGKWYLVWNTVPTSNWKVLATLPASELNAQAYSLGIKLSIIGILAVIVCAVVVVIIVNNITKTLKNVKTFAGELSNGNFTVNPLSVQSQDELGKMSESLNQMYHANKEIITNISTESNNINDDACTLGAMSEELSAEFVNIQENMSAVNDAMMTSGAGTEQVSASVQEVNSSVQNLAVEAAQAATEVKDIKARAKHIRHKNRAACENAIHIAQQRQAEIEAANEKAQIVHEIENMAQSISEIASQINLLSLNASIEAARAGDAGKGFAVVAQEINTLATETDATVGRIQETIDGIQEAFSDLASGSNKLLDFITQTVTVDYDNFVQIGKQYGEDADLFEHLSDKMSEMADHMANSMEEVDKAVANIAESAQSTASRSANITESINSVSEAVENVAELATKQQTTAAILADIVNQFKLK